MRQFLIALFALVGAPVWAATVSLAGFSYSGDAASIASRFPYTQRFAAAMTAAGQSPDRLVSQTLANTKIEHFTLQQGELAQLKGRDQAIAVAMVITSETVSHERFGGLYKLFVNLRGQALFFDFKSMTILRSYPITAAYLDVLAAPPSDELLDDRVHKLFVGDGDKTGLIQRFASQLATAQLPDHVPRFLQVGRVSITPEALAELPEAFKATPTTAETWLADQLSEMLATRAGVPVLPYAKGYAIGNSMAMRFADGTVFNLKIPEADYTFSVDLKQFKRVKTGESAAGASYVYGSFVDLKLVEPLSGRSYLDARIKNGEVKLVPATQSEVDDFPAYSVSLRSLFSKFTSVLGGKDDPWVRSAVTASDINAQISATKTVLQSCK